MVKKELSQKVKAVNKPVNQSSNHHLWPLDLGSDWMDECKNKGLTHPYGKGEAFSFLRGLIYTKLFIKWNQNNSVAFWLCVYTTTSFKISDTETFKILVSEWKFFKPPGFVLQKNAIYLKVNVLAVSQWFMGGYKIIYKALNITRNSVKFIIKKWKNIWHIYTVSTKNKFSSQAANVQEKTERPLKTPVTTLDDLRTSPGRTGATCIQPGPD